MNDLDNWIASHVEGEPMEWPPDPWLPIFTELGRIVYTWNSIEKSCALILNRLAGDDHQKMSIIIAHMGSKIQMDAIKTLANEFLDPKEKATILHMIKVFEDLRERRNYFVHSFSGLTVLSSNMKSYGFSIDAYRAQFSSQTARGRLKSDEMVFDAAAIKEEVRLFNAADFYFSLIFSYFLTKGEDPPTLPEEFPRPDKLMKNPRFALDDPLRNCSGGWHFERSSCEDPVNGLKCGLALDSCC